MISQEPGSHPGSLDGVVVITGVMASGKSTIAQLLAERSARAVHVRGDVFRRFVVRGRVEPRADMSEAAWSQLLLRYRLAMITADSYAEAGFFVVVQDVIIGPVLEQALAMLQTPPVRLVVLDPDPAVVALRERARPKSGYGERWDPAELVEALRQTTPRLGLWLDTGGQSPAETVDDILARAAEALVTPCAGSRASEAGRGFP